MSQLMVGQMLYGYCGGHFGRDSYEDKRIEAVGADWVVARQENGEVVFAEGEGAHEVLFEYTTKKESEW